MLGCAIVATVFASLNGIPAHLDDAATEGSHFWVLNVVVLVELLANQAADGKVQVLLVTGALAQE